MRRCCAATPPAVTGETTVRLADYVDEILWPAAIDALLDAAREAGETRVSLLVEDGSSAVDFYVRNGFEQVVAQGGAIMARSL